MELKNIVIDRGNSSIKAGFFYGSSLEEEFLSSRENDLFEWVFSKKPKFILFSSVAQDSGTALKSKFRNSKFVFLNSKTPLPFHNLYESPETLGTDRLAGVAGAFSKFPYENCLVVDAGSCITYDFIDQEGNYRGGGISPGLRMRFKALNSFTSKLPLIEPNKEFELVGNNTSSSILNGVLHGVVSEIDGMIGKYRQKHNDLKVFICGGDTKFFESKLKEHIFAVANLVLFGLNRILLHNIKDFEADI